MKVIVDRTRCTGLGICESIAPHHFEVDDDGVLVLLSDEIGQAGRKDVEQAVASCPTEALSTEEVDQ